jgi:DNA-binding transcriptional LysR family regulator
VFDDLRQAVKSIEFLADPAAGEVRVGSPPPIAASFVSAVVDRLSRQHPRMVFHIVATDEEILRRGLHERSIDLLIGRKAGPRFGMLRLSSRPCMMIHSLSSRARRAPGPGDAAFGFLI